MIRNLKAPMLASMALAALGAVTASAAQADYPHFISPGFEGNLTLTTTKDSHEVVSPNTTAKTSHQVFDIRKADGTGSRSITCNEVEIDDATIPASAKGTTTELTATLTFKGECQFIGQTVTVNMGACDFLLTADGTVHIRKDNNVEGECKHGKNPISFEATGCKVEVGQQTVSGVKYHNIETGGVKMITLEATNLEGIEYNSTGANCNYGTTKNATFTTGNAILTAEKTGTSEMVGIEWTIEGSPPPPPDDHFYFPEAGETTITSTKDDLNPPEGTTGPKTAHQVLDIRKADGTGVRSLTCNETSADGVVKGESVEEITLDFKYQGECQFLGQEVTVSPGACNFLFTSDGTLHIEGAECEHGKKPINWEAVGCKVEIGRQTITGVEYHNVEGLITVEMSNLAFEYNATGTNCSYGTTGNGLITTANTILTGSPIAMVDIEWTTKEG